MKESDSWLTPRQAGELAGYTHRHILNYIKSGKLAATRENGNFYIDKSEFFRCFPDVHKKTNAGNSRKFSEEEVRIQIEMENKYLKESIHDKEKQNEYLKQQLDNFTQEKNLMLQAINSHTRLLEHHDKSEKEQKGWLKSLFSNKKG